ncbi:TIR domain-containing protein [soil metagenome]
MAKSVFFSFHYDRDAWRVQQVANMGSLEGQPILNSQDWEKIKRQGDAGIKRWIAGQMAYRSAVVVLIGNQTAGRPWVRYEIIEAWNDRKPLLGVRIHGLADRNGHSDGAGADPFASIKLEGGSTLADYIPVYTPSGSNSQTIYSSIKTNLSTWVANAYKRT